MAEIDFNIFR